MSRNRSRNRGGVELPGEVVVDAGVGRAAVRRDPHNPTARLLEVDGHVHGAIDLADPARPQLDYLVRLAAVVEALLPAGPGHVVHLGGGAFALPRTLAGRRPDLTQLVVERSRAIIRLAERELGLRRTTAIRVARGDARLVLRRQPDRSADVVIGDAFVGDETPRHLSTVEFAAEVARALRPDGVYVVNLIDEPPWPVLSTQAATVRTALPHVLAVGSRGVAHLRTPGNVLLVASRTALGHDALARRVAAGSHPSVVLAGARLAALADRAHPRYDVHG